MSLMSLGVISLCVCEKGAVFDEFRVRLMTLAVGLEEELGDEFGGDFDEFDEFGGHFLVCLEEQGVRLMSLGCV